MSKEYLDETGLDALVAKIKNYVSGVIADLLPFDSLEVTGNTTTGSLDVNGDGNVSNGVFTVSNDEDGGEAQFKATNNLRTGLFEVSKTGRLGIWDTTNDVWSIYSDTDQSVYIPHPLYVEGTQVPTIVSGVTASTTVAAGSYVDVSVTFGHTFSSAPAVQISPIWNTTSTNAYLVQFAVLSRSTTGCTIRILNGHTSLFGPAVIWTAIGN